jgi:hypothetical protein
MKRAILQNSLLESKNPNNLRIWGSEVRILSGAPYNILASLVNLAYATCEDFLVRFISPPCRHDRPSTAATEWVSVFQREAGQNAAVTGTWLGYKVRSLSSSPKSDAGKSPR